MNSSLRTEPASGIAPRSRLAATNLKDTSHKFSENVENAFSLTCPSGVGSEGAVGASLGNGRSSDTMALVETSIPRAVLDIGLPAEVSNSATRLLTEPAVLLS